MQHIATDPSGVDYLFNSEDSNLYRKEGKSTHCMGHIRNFVPPYVPEPSNMKSLSARQITGFAKEWIRTHKEINHV